MHALLETLKFACFDAYFLHYNSAADPVFLVGYGLMISRDSDPDLHVLHFTVNKDKLSKSCKLHFLELYLYMYIYPISPPIYI